MKGNIVKIIINVLAMVFISYYATRKGSAVTGDTGSVYDIRIPGMLTGLCYAYGILGLIFLTVVLIASKSSDSVTNGHYYIGAVMVAIGIVGFIFCKNWKISVSENAILYTNVIGITKEYSKAEIRDVTVGKKNELVIGFDRGKVTVDPATVNYSRLYDELVK